MSFADQMKLATQLARENSGLVIVPKLKPHVLPTLMHDPYGFGGKWDFNETFANGPSGYYDEVSEWPTFDDSPRHDFFQPIREHFVGYDVGLKPDSELSALMRKVFERSSGVSDTPDSVIDKPVGGSKPLNWRDYQDQWSVQFKPTPIKITRDENEGKDSRDYVTMIEFPPYKKPQDEEPHPSGIPWAMGPNESGLVRLASGRVSYRGVITQEFKEDS